jgi:hypothetical protein
VVVISKQRQPQSGGESDGFGAFGHTRFKIEDYAKEIEDLRHTEFKKFTDNFIAVETQPGDVDWFKDADWQVIAHNLSVMAHVAKEGGCVGLELDPEEYGAHLFTPGAWPEAQRKKHTLEEYIAKARQRGQHVMRAINAEYPKIKILCLYGPPLTAQFLNDPHGYYRLWAPFLEGMCSAAKEGTQIIDGFEQSYGFKTAAEFEQGRKTQFAAREIFVDKPAFDRVMKMGFGLWQDNQSGQLGWHPNEPAKNYFQPNTWQDAVHYALSYSDEYVWVWHERINFWTGKDVGEDYLKAQVEAKK